jgi:hypothetical protein
MHHGLLVLSMVRMPSGIGASSISSSYSNNRLQKICWRESGLAQFVLVLPCSPRLTGVEHQALNCKIVSLERKQKKLGCRGY